jgi:hypothetical protein
MKKCYVLVDENNGDISSRSKVLETFFNALYTRFYMVKLIKTEY